MDKVLFIEGYHEMTRPADIPADWTIYNAPRPLYGHKRWQGDFRHGIFFAAVAPGGDPADEFGDAAEYHKRNRELDGHECLWVSKADVMAYGAQKAAEYEVDLDEFDYKDIVSSFVDNYERQAQPA